MKRSTKLYIIFFRISKKKQNHPRTEHLFACSFIRRRQKSRMFFSVNKVILLQKQQPELSYKNLSRRHSTCKTLFKTRKLDNAVRIGYLTKNSKTAISVFRWFSNSLFVFSRTNGAILCSRITMHFHVCKKLFWSSRVHNSIVILGLTGIDSQNLISPKNWFSFLIHDFNRHFETSKREKQQRHQRFSSFR